MFPYELVVEESTITLGDWSDDGHGKYEEVYVRHTYSTKALKEAYKKSCKKTKIKLHKYLCSDHEDRYLSTEQEKELAEIGIPIGEIIKNFSDDEDFGFDRTVTCQLFVEILMHFIKLSLEDLSWEIFELKKPECFNGYWGKLNETFGYGLY